MLCAGIPPFYDNESDKVTTLLRQKVQNDKARVFVPEKEGCDRARYAYVAYDWIWAFAQRRVTPEELAPTYSPAFEDLRKDMLSHGPPGTVDKDEFQKDFFIVVTDGRSLMPTEIEERGRVRF